MAEVIPCLVLGGLSDARRAIRNGEDAAFLCLLPQEDIKAEEGLLSVFSSKKGQSTPFLFQDVRDEVQQASKMRTILPECVDFVEAQRAQGNKCIVFCRWGQSRSSTVVIAHLMLRQGYSLHRAFWLVRGLRQNAFPNVGFFRMLQDMDRELFGRVSMTETRNEYLAINLNKQVIPMHAGVKALSRCMDMLQPKNLLDTWQHRGPGGPEGGALEEARGIWQVAEGIFASDEVSASDEISVRAKRINRMLSLIPDQQARPDWADESIQYLGVPISDDPCRAAQSLAEWQQCHEFLHAAGKSARTLVFCNNGHNRSSAIIISHLMINTGYTLHQAYWSVRQRLPTFFPNVAFFEVLKTMEQRLRNGSCSMPLAPEEYLKLESQGCSNQAFRLHEQVAKGCERSARKMLFWKRPAALRDFRLYGPLGISLSGRLSLGDLCLVGGFTEVPTCRCLLVAGCPAYCEDQSKETGLDIYRIEVLTPVPPDGVHQVRVALRVVHVVINPNDLKIYLADDQDLLEEERWLEMEIHCSPFRDEDVNKELMQRLVRDVERAPCTQAGEAHGDHGRRRGHANRLVWTSLQDFRERWQEMLESPVDAPVRIWHRYLWEDWYQNSDSRNSRAFEDFQKELERIMPLGEDSSYDGLESFLRSKDGHWCRLDLQHAETRYTKHMSSRESRIDPGEPDDIEKFTKGLSKSLVGKSFSVDSLCMDFLAELGKGRHGIAYRAVITTCRDKPAWLKNIEVCVKVWHGAGDHSTWENEVAAMQRLPATVPHRTRFIAAGRLRTCNPSSAAGFLDLAQRLPASEYPNAIVTTLASGLPLSKALDSRTAGQEGGLAHSELSLRSAIRQILEFSVAMEVEQSYHGDMTLDNAFWDGSANEITVIDFGNAGLTAQDPWHRTQKIGTMYLLAAMRERLKKDPLVTSGPGSCLAWLRELKGEVAAASSKKGFGTMMPRFPLMLQTAGMSERRPFANMVKGRFERTAGALPHAGSMERLQLDFDKSAPKAVLGQERLAGSSASTSDAALADSCSSHTDDAACTARSSRGHHECGLNLAPGAALLARPALPSEGDLLLPE